MFSKRLAPFYVMASTIPFGDEIGDEALEAALHRAARYKRFAHNRREYAWTVPVGTVARYVRIQIDSRTEYMHMAQVEVYGSWGDAPKGKPVSSVACGRDATLVVVSPETDRRYGRMCRGGAFTSESRFLYRNLEMFYKRAIAADPHNAMILRELDAYAEAYAKCVGEYCTECSRNASCSSSCQVRF